MSSTVITLHEEHLCELAPLVRPPDGHEGVGYLLMGRSRVDADPWDGQPRLRYLSHRVIPIDPRDVISSSPEAVTTRTRTLARVLKEAQAEDLAVAVVHGHPSGFDRFSEQDDRDEPHLAQLAVNRNGADAELLSVVLCGADRIIARIWRGPLEVTDARDVRVVGQRISLKYPGRSRGEASEAFHRQTLAFGPGLAADLAHLRIGVIGCGATGSATAVMLARLGAIHLVLVDNDRVEETNLNRLHGATRADIGRPKAEVLREHIESFGLGTQIVTHQTWAGDARCRDVLRSCDIVFGCTDDHDGRLLLSRLAYYYLTPVFDMGIGIHLIGNGAGSRISDASGRVTVVGPGDRCLMCRGVVDVVRAAEDDLKRRDPHEHASRVEEKYVRGGGLPNPAVITFTTDVACMAVDELIHRLTGYRGDDRCIPHRERKFHLLSDKTPGPRVSEDCPICRRRDFWGRGDTTPFLGRMG